MKSKVICIYYAVCLALTIVLLSGCASDQLADCQQENQELQKTIEAQKAEIENLQSDQEMALEYLFETTGELDDCKKQIAELERKKTVAEKMKNLTPEKLKEGLAELKAAQKASAERLKAKAAAKEAAECNK